MHSQITGAHSMPNLNKIETAASSFEITTRSSVKIEVTESQPTEIMPVQKPCNPQIPVSKHSLSSRKVTLNYYPKQTAPPQ